MSSPQRRTEIIDALRRGTVPRRGLEHFAVGLEGLEEAIQGELERVAQGGASCKCIRGEYGNGKTFLARWVQEKAQSLNFATSEVQISETETPLHRLETVYRRAMERLATREAPTGALRSIIDSWFYCLEEDALAAGGIDAQDEKALVAATEELLTARLREISKVMPAFSAALRGYRSATAAKDEAMAEALIAWLAGQPNVAASIKRYAGIKGDIDHFGALSCIQGLLAILKDSGKAGLVLVLDEVETLQRVRGDVREKGLNALRQLIDELDSGRYPGLYLVVTGTPAFYDGPQGIQRLPPLAQRLHVDFSLDRKFDNPRAVQVRLSPFDLGKLKTVGIKVRDIYAQQSKNDTRIRQRVDDEYLGELATRVTGKLGGKVGIAPRLFLRKLVGEILDRVDLHEDFDPRKDYPLTITSGELSNEERASLNVDDVDLDV